MVDIPGSWPPEPEEGGVPCCEMCGNPSDTLGIDICTACWKILQDGLDRVAHLQGAAFATSGDDPIRVHLEFSGAEARVLYNALRDYVHLKLEWCARQKLEVGSDAHQSSCLRVTTVYRVVQHLDKELR